MPSRLEFCQKCFDYKRVDFNLGCLGCAAVKAENDKRYQEKLRALDNPEG